MITQMEIAGISFPALFETEAAPLTLAAIGRILPYERHIIHVRGSGEACWIPLGSHDVGIG